MKKLLMILAALCALFLLKEGRVSADSNSYNVYSWADMYTAYQNAPDQSTVVLNVKQDIVGDEAAYKGQEVSEGKSVTIKGNGHTLFFGRYANNPTKGTAVSAGAAKHSGFYTSSDKVSEQTTLRLENAVWINSINYGLFEVDKDAAATTVYQNVTEMNGALDNGGTPIMNRKGAIAFYGNNTFNITGQVSKNYGSGAIDTNSFGKKATGTLDDTNWIQGANNIAIYDGSTTVNNNSTYQKTLYHYQSSDLDASLTVKKKAKLYWNYGTAWFLEQEKVRSKTWNLEDQSTFIINGTANTAKSSGYAFGFSNEQANWTINLDNRAQLDATIGGSFNLGTSYTNLFNVSDNADLSLNNVSKTTRTFQGGFGSGGGISMSDSAHVLLRGGQQVYDTLSYVFLNGQGLPLSVSKNYDGTDAKKEEAAAGNAAISRMSFFNYTSRIYSYSTQEAIKKAKYIEFGIATPKISLTSTKLDRAFRLGSSDLPSSFGWSKLISAEDSMNFTVNANKSLSDASVQVAIKQNNQKGIVSYYWKDNEGNETALSDTPTTVWSMSRSQYQTTGQGTFLGYTANFDQDHGLLMKTTNQLKGGTYDGATIDYTLSNGPTS
ncbi:hypothetical protein LQZ24_04245 [Fructobacillus sp. M1-13]|uniref:Uncharacterized protein n=1 Tax=Fructobacillus papyriferae TaxID=2713171 RepID=A0ABS5QSK7_9LACO|nr:pectate lyase-like adhesive domain-containing protein [Fructobacillus papyriferae]MBS9335465.1 hypothetical protein [Fructobacillus papyriferae]MCD2159235.1 hypothetical protein [Fructobacillus papyriferae]